MGPIYYQGFWLDLCYFYLQIFVPRYLGSILMSQKITKNHLINTKFKYFCTQYSYKCILQVQRIL